MCARHRFFTAAAAALVLAALLFVASPALVADNRHAIAGTWVTWASPMPGMQVPVLQTFSADGTVVSSDVTMFGGLPGLSIRVTPMHGLWERTGRNVIKTTSLAMVYDASTSLLIGFVRSRATGSFNEAGEVVGTLIPQFLGCASPVACPDPLSPDATWGLVPGFPASMTFTSTRLQLVE
jgi:hypothetical protein